MRRGSCRRWREVCCRPNDRPPCLNRPQREGVRAGGVVGAVQGMLRARLGRGVGAPHLLQDLGGRSSLSCMRQPPAGLTNCGGLRSVTCQTLLASHTHVIDGNKKIPLCNREMHFDSYSIRVRSFLTSWSCDRCTQTRIDLIGPRINNIYSSCRSYVGLRVLTCYASNGSDPEKAWLGAAGMARHHSSGGGGGGGGEDGGGSGGQMGKQASGRGGTRAAGISPGGVARPPPRGHAGAARSAVDVAAGAAAGAHADCGLTPAASTAKLLVWRTHCSLPLIRLAGRPCNPPSYPSPARFHPSGYKSQFH